MHLLWLARVEDDTIFIITLVVLLGVVIAYLVLGRDETIRLKESEGVEGEGESELKKKLFTSWTARTICWCPFGTVC